MMTVEKELGEEGESGKNEGDREGRGIYRQKSFNLPPRPQDYALDLVHELLRDTKSIRKVVSRLQGREGRGLEASMRDKTAANAASSGNVNGNVSVNVNGSDPSAGAAADSKELRENVVAATENEFTLSLFSVSHLQRLQAELHLLCCASQSASDAVSEVVSKLPSEKVETLLSLLDALQDYSLSDFLRISAYGTLQPPMAHHTNNSLSPRTSFHSLPDLMNLNSYRSKARWTKSRNVFRAVRMTERRGHVPSASSTSPSSPASSITYASKPLLNSMSSVANRGSRLIRHGAALPSVNTTTDHVNENTQQQSSALNTDENSNSSQKNADLNTSESSNKDINTTNITTTTTTTTTTTSAPINTTSSSNANTAVVTNSNSNASTSNIDDDEKMQRRRIALNKFRKGAIAATSGLYMKRMLRVSDEEQAMKLAEELREKMSGASPMWVGPLGSGVAENDAGSKMKSSTSSTGFSPLFQLSSAEALRDAEQFFQCCDANKLTPLFRLCCIAKRAKEK